MSPIYEQVRKRRTLKKSKIFNISLNIAHFSFFFLKSLIPTCTIHFVNLMLFLCLALNLETLFKKCDILETRSKQEPINRKIMI